ncbi:hypothetical protein OG689_20470 [Kitasatospora sp. NBC_00240]|uniref:hypothetical protein n=1 Tax=Kitasatospora sp. NBC_00240 TaxID=2903567 RepID=UPI00225BADBA|nr:hypothetical protein [Kitasatospora sp. NBC_00240]MCX5211635.1 hypothetical protein [Kitasatospora sp. NBC_00240]
MRVRQPDPRHQGWWRRRLPALTLALAVVATLSVLPLGLGPATEAQAATGVTVEGPEIWDPASGTYGARGQVSVSHGRNLTNEVVQVSWSGFTPTVMWDGTPASLVREFSAEVMYPVRIYQCRGDNPKPTDCYGNTMYGGDPALGFEQPSRPDGTTTPDFPSNHRIAVTGPDGSGTASIEVWTSTQSPSLGCDATHPCSIVVEPNYGGDPLDNFGHRGAADCADHSLDMDFESNTATDLVFTGLENPKTHNRTGEQCAWTHRAVVPLEFAPTAADCKAAAADFDAAGLEMANRALQQWRSGLCKGDAPLNLQYSFAGGEPQARGDFLAGSGPDIALTARADTGAAPRPYVYAPLATTGISVVFVVDDPNTGREIRNMRLNARLLAKLLTQSYTFGASDIVSVAGNPSNIFVDPEFQQLNPVSLNGGASWPTFAGPDMLPVVLGGTTDLVHQLTSWIASDPEASQFLQGSPDPWGMHVDSFYLRPKFAGYPVEALQPQDFSGIPGETGDKAVWKQWEWNPLLGGLGQVGRNMLQFQGTALRTDADGNGNHPRVAAQTIGQRTMFAILDAGQAKAFALPEAALRNPAGAFVAPGLDSYQAAVADMPVDPVNGTQHLPYGVDGTAFTKDQGAYPLTTVQYAMTPTSGLSAAKAKAVSAFLKRVTDQGEGQIYGLNPGQLAPGFLGLTPSQSAQAKAAVAHVSTQDGALPGNQTAPAAEGGTEGGSSSGGSASGGGTGSAGGGVGDQGSGATTGGTGSSGGTGGTSGDTFGGGTAGGAGTTAGAAATAPAAAKPGASPSAAASGGALDAAPVAAGRPAPDRAGTARLLLPVALIAGLVLLVGGPAALVLGGTPAGGRLVAGVRSGWARLRGTRP